MSRLNDPTSPPPLFDVDDLSAFEEGYRVSASRPPSASEIKEAAHIEVKEEEALITLDAWWFPEESKRPRA